MAGLHRAGGRGQASHLLPQVEAAARTGGKVLGVLLGPEGGAVAGGRLVLEAEAPGGFGGD